MSRTVPVLFFVPVFVANFFREYCVSGSLK